TVELSGTKSAATGRGLARAHNLRELSLPSDKHALAACCNVRGKGNLTTITDGVRLEVEREVAAAGRRITENGYRCETIRRRLSQRAVPQWLRQSAVPFGSHYSYQGPARLRWETGKCGMCQP